MIGRACARKLCGKPFNVNYPSDPKRYCHRRCAGLEKAGPKTMSAAEASRRGAEGLGEFEAFAAGVRVALAYHEQRAAGPRGSDLELKLLVLEATQE